MPQSTTGLTSVIRRPTLLAFERRFELESRPCVSCAGTGQVTRHSVDQAPTCWNCRGLGRRITALGRRLFHEICELLGDPLSVAARESRIKPRHLEQILGERLRPGMLVRPSLPWTNAPFRLVSRIEDTERVSRRVQFADGAAGMVSPTSSFERRLTDHELDQVEALMSARVGMGATLPSARPHDALRRIPPD